MADKFENLRAIVDAAINTMPGHGRYDVDGIIRELNETEPVYGHSASDALREIIGRHALVDSWHAQVTFVVQAPAHDTVSLKCGLAGCDWLRDVHMPFLLGDAIRDAVQHHAECHVPAGRSRTGQ